MCSLFGFTRQAYYQFFKTFEDTNIKDFLVLKEVLAKRKDHPRVGVRKLYIMLQSFLIEHHIKMGRDALFDLLAREQLLIRSKKRNVTTTMSRHFYLKHSNLIKGLEAISINHIWVSDITYWKCNDIFYYISLITDAFSHKIVGYNVAETLEAVHSAQALKMAILGFKGPYSHPQLVHHSDRGIQYCCAEYVTILQKNNIAISMTQSGDPLDNAIAERINGIIKNEYLHCYEVDTIKDAKQLLTEVVALYNTERLHMSIGYQTPEYVHQNKIKMNKVWKNYRAIKMLDVKVV